MQRYLTLPLPARLYVATVVAIGFAVLTQSLLELRAGSVRDGWFILAALTLLSGSITVKLPSASATISVSETFVFTSVLLFGTAAGTLTVALDGLIISLWLLRRDPRAHRVLFNVAAPSLSLWVAAQLFFYLSGVPPLAYMPINGPVPVTSLLLPLTAFTVTYFLLNTWLITLAIALERSERPLRIWQVNFMYLSLNYFVGASAAALLVSYTREVNLTALGIIVPLLIASFLSYKASMGRVEDTTRHLAELNHLYLSTIEALAMAIDAKDQITHGHVRRVQRYSLGLAKSLGVRDDGLIRAIEAAALLHDMGKLAVPEYILNKPGKLTAAEFQKMKLHASVGADILSSVNFPYPVVPIVRHHHENWDGTGYPDGLTGADIPIGARILAVADCFDALTSDRPYRPRLSDAEAIQILVDRREVMYDPLIVDTFVAVQQKLVAADTTVVSPRMALEAIADAAQLAPAADDQPRGLENISASSDETLALYDLARTLAGRHTVGDIWDAVSTHLRRILPASLVVFYAYDPLADGLVADHASGDSASLVVGLRIPLAQRLSGWVAANRRTILNSDPVLDLGEVARQALPRLASCLSTPLLTGSSDLVGVLTLYAVARSAYSEDHRRILEVVARQIADRIYDVRNHGVSLGSEARETSWKALAHFDRLQQLVAPQADSLQLPVSLIVVDVDRMKALNEAVGRAAADKVLSGIEDCIRRTLRSCDLVIRYQADEFLIALPNADSETAVAVASRIQQVVNEAAVEVPLPQARVSVSVGTATAPGDGRALAQLVHAAYSRLAHRDKWPRPPSVH